MLPMDENGYVGDLQNAWLRTSDDKTLNYPATIASFCAYELKDTWGFRVVSRESATNLCNHETRAVGSDHIGIVKPTSSTDDPYVYFKAAYLRTFSGLPRATAKAIEQSAVIHPLFRNPDKFRATQYNDIAQEFSVYGFKFVDSIDAPCYRTTNGTVRVSYKIPESEDIIEVVPTFEQAEPARIDASLALVSYTEQVAEVNYRLSNSHDDDECPLPARGDLVVNVVTKRHPIARNSQAPGE
jgi:hypothetical protein